MVDGAGHYPSFAVVALGARGVCKSLRAPGRPVAHGMLAIDAGVTAMGKALAAWLLVAAAMAAPATNPRNVVQGAVTRVVSVLEDDFVSARWRAYDVLVDGVSFGATFRTEFERIIQQSSYAGLIDKLRKRTT